MDKLKKSFSSDLDALIEKFRMETNRQSEEDFINTRCLTTESSYKPPDIELSHDIDKQITDLESLIKRLQDEIIDMSNDADKPLVEDDLSKWFSKAYNNFEINEDGRTNNNNNIDSDPGRSSRDSTNNNTDLKSTDNKPDQTNSHVFPVIIPNVNPLNTDQHNNVTDDYVSYTDSPSTSELAANFTEIRKNFSLLWDDVENEVVSKKDEDEVVSKKDEYKNPSAHSIEFTELRAELIESISRIATEMPLCNSKEDLN